MFACATMPCGSFARSSGGYSHPSGAIRTPSFGGGGGAVRTPSTSGGYSRSFPSSAGSLGQALPQSPGDRSLSKGGSGAALNAFRAQPDASRPVSGYQSNAPNLQSPTATPFGQYGAPRRPDRSNWFDARGWSAPAYGGGNRSFGVWDGLFLGALLSNLNRPGSSDFFHNNQNDPGYRQWRAEADRQAQDNADLRRKLNELDRQLAERGGQPVVPGALPPDVPSEIAKAPPRRTPPIPDDEGGSGWLWVVLLVGGSVLLYLAWRRHTAVAGGRSPGGGLQTAGAMLRHKLSGEGYTPSKFRVGMTLALDPTPFILAAGSIKLPQPEGSGLISVSAVGRVVSGTTEFIRLYLPDGRSLVQLHLDAIGGPDECRLFGTIDEVTPADAQEWGAWLDPNEGMIGWPVFQTKDGKIHSRVWIPGDTRVSPFVMTEMIESLSAPRSVQSQVMLYAAPTGAADPAPVTEYVMVAAIQDGGRAWVEIRAGIDLNPATLQLA
jgi:Protein of unknown function (DUF2491)